MRTSPTTQRSTHDHHRLRVRGVHVCAAVPVSRTQKGNQRRCSSPSSTKKTARCARGGFLSFIKEKVIMRSPLPSRPTPRAPNACVCVSPKKKPRARRAGAFFLLLNKGPICGPRHPSSDARMITIECACMACTFAPPCLFLEPKKETYGGAHPLHQRKNRALRARKASLLLLKKRSL